MTRVKIEITLGLLLVLITSAVMLLYGFDEEERMGRFALAQEAQAIEVGASLFEANCSGCHGPKGGGVPGLAPALNDRYLFTQRLRDVGWSGTLEDYIIATVSSGRLVSTRPDLYVGGGRPAMPAWADSFGGPLRTDQIRSIARFVLNWEATAMGQVELVELPTPVAEDPISRGQQVYTTSGCGGCHVLGSLSAGVIGPNLTQIGTTAETRIEGMSAEEYIQNSILQPNSYLVTGFVENIMPQTFGTTLTPEQLADLVAFLLAQK